MRFLPVFLTLGALVLPAQNAPQTWRDWIGQGVAAFRSARYPDAVTAFEKARDANPASPIPHLYLGFAWSQQFIPGVMAPENDAKWRHAEAEFRLALERDPRSTTALLMLGKLAFDQRRLEEAAEWYRKAAAVEPARADIWFALGVIAWQRAPDSPEAAADLEKAIALNPQHEEAMTWLSLVLERRHDSAAAAEMRKRAEDARSENIQKAYARGPIPPDTADPDPVLKQSAWVAFAFPPPVPPPPPPSISVLRSRSRSTPGATVSWEPAPADGSSPAPPQRVDAATQAHKLIRKVNPEYPVDISVKAPLRFVIVIGKDGRVVKQNLVSGNIWLRPAAEDALRQWSYEPTVVDGAPVEVVTEVQVEFQPAR
jgi:hypothetical protein